MDTVIKGFVRQCVVAIGVLAALSVLLGLAYPAAVWGISRVNGHGAEGSQVTDASGCPVGSSLIGLDPHVAAGVPDPFLHARVLGAAGEQPGTDNPMAPGDASASAASNKGPNNDQLQQWITQRRSIIAERENVAPSAVPIDAVTGSGSGLDPHISPAYAELQVPRLARENQRSPQQIRDIIAAHTDGRQLGYLGQPVVDVLDVNLALGHTVKSCVPDR